MEILQSAILGVVQGLTEFLPVSSSGHLVLTQSIIGFESPGVVFEAVLHAGTLLAIVYFYRKTLTKLPIGYWILIGIGTIPAVLVGLIAKDAIEAVFESTLLVGVMLIVTGFINFAIDRQTSNKLTIPTQRNSLLIGAFQAFAILPGVSRSASTIFAARLSGIKKHEAAQFSFLLSVPAVLGANVLLLADYNGSVSGNLSSLVVGFVCAFASGYFAIRLVLRYLDQSKFRYFGYYTIILGVVTIVLSVV